MYCAPTGGHRCDLQRRGALRLSDYGTTNPTHGHLLTMNLLFGIDKSLKTSRIQP